MQASLSRSATLAACLVGFCLLSPANAASVITSSAPPKIDFEALGNTIIAGNFAGLSIYDGSTGRNATATSGQGQSLLGRSANGQLNILGTTNDGDGGSISALCQTTGDNQLVYLGGSFTSIGGVEAANVASFDPSTNSFAALGSGVDGAIQSVYCDNDANLLYVGGDMTGSFASWDVSSSTWTVPTLSINELNGPVTSIESAGSGSDRSILLGGSFTYSISNSTGESANTSAVQSLGSSLTPISLNTPRSYTWAGPARSDSAEPEEVFCPSGDGLTGTTWLAADDTAAIFVVRLYTPQQVGGIRIGNAFKDGRGTRQFKVISVPDSIVQTLQYYSDPSDPISELFTCQWECPLSDNSSIPYQDFLFPQGTTATGFQINIDRWYGEGGGFHQVSLLSDGSYSYAQPDLNPASSSACTSGSAALELSTSSTSGTWTTREVPSTISGVNAQALQATVPVGTSPADSPSLQFAPAITAPGGYNVSLVVPGCSQTGDCAYRTSVEIEINPGPGLGVSTTVTIDQTNAADASRSVYTGALVSGATFTMRLASQPIGSGSGGNYRIIATRLALIAQTTDGRPVVTRSAGAGLLEYIPSGANGAWGETSVTANSNATAFDVLSLSLSSNASVSAIASAASGQVFFGGSFQPNANVTTANVAAYAGPSSSGATLPAGGLNGEVKALLVHDGWLYAAGAFSAAADGSVTSLNNVARWQYGSSDATWQALIGGNSPEFGSDGATDLSASQIDGDDVILVAGSSNGLAIYNHKARAWDTSSSSFIIGSFSALPSSPPQDGNGYMAGSIEASFRWAGSGALSLQSNRSGYPELVPLGLNFSTPTPSAAVSTSSSSARSSSSSSAASSTGASGLARRATVAKRAPAPGLLNLPGLFGQGSSGSAEVFAGAFWKNSSDPTTILGGSFSTNDVSNLGAYSSEANALRALPDLAPITGPVHALAVWEDVLFIGGNFTAPGNGFLAYNMKTAELANNIPALQAYDGTNATVNVIVASPQDDDAILVAGAFSAAGDVACIGVCQWHQGDEEWSALGSGLNGVVGALDVAGEDSQYLLAAGSFQLNGASAAVARYDFDSAQWSLLGDTTPLPGPATAISADNRNESSVYVAGSSIDGTTPYAFRWNGVSWTDIGTGALGAGSSISQLAFIPLSDDGDSNDAMEGNRRLLASGQLALEGYGDASSAFFDGANWYPFIISTTPSGAAGSISSMFYSVSGFRLSKNHLSVGLVVLISIAISLGIVFLLVLIGFIIAIRYRHNEQKQNHLGAAPVDYDNDSTEEKRKHRPTSLLATLNAATAMMTQGGKEGKEPRRIPSRSTNGYEDDSRSIGEENLGQAAVARMRNTSSQIADEEEDDLVRMRYSFHAEAPGELDCEVGEEIRVLDRSDSAWHYAIRERDGQRGVVPSSYIF